MKVFSYTRAEEVTRLSLRPAFNRDYIYTPCCKGKPMAKVLGYGP